MKLQGDYSLFGRILLIPLNGRGQVFLDAGKISFTPLSVHRLMHFPGRKHDCHNAHKDATVFKGRLHLLQCDQLSRRLQNGRPQIAFLQFIQWQQAIR